MGFVSMYDDRYVATRLNAAIILQGEQMSNQQLSETIIMLCVNFNSIKKQTNNGECDWRRLLFAFYPRLRCGVYVAACFTTACKRDNSPAKPSSFFYFAILDTQTKQNWPRFPYIISPVIQLLEYNKL